MSCELILGPMFAGKSSAIQSIVRRHRALGWEVFVVTHTLDTRYSVEPAIVNHDRVVLPAQATGHLMPCLDDAQYVESRLVVVEEGQFFPDLVPFVMHAVETDGKHVVVAGLDGDANRRPFGRILDLMPICDRVTKMTALCKQCADGTPAIFTYDNQSSLESEQIQVGGEDRYSALCRKHYRAAKQGLCTYVRR
jgi:thymidine kinase